MNLPFCARILWAGPLLGLLACCLPACDSEYPPERGGRIRGTIYYQPEASLDVSDYALGIMLVTEKLSPTGVFPHNLKILAWPEFTPDGIPYELKHIAPYQYFVAAMLVSLDEPDADIPPVVGLYPDICSYLATPDGARVKVTEGEPVEGIDITLYGQNGMLHPCLTGH